MAVAQIEPTLKPYDTYLPPINSRRLQDSPLNNLEEVAAWMHLHRPEDTDEGSTGNLEFLCEMNTLSLKRFAYLLQLCQNKRTTQLRKTLLEQQDLIRMPCSFWTESQHHTCRGGWWVRAMSEELTAKCTQCRRIWPARQLETDGCTLCDITPPKKGKPIRPKRKLHKPNLKQTLGLVMCTALPEEIERMADHKIISDTTLTLPNIQCCLEEMMRELGHSDSLLHGMSDQPPSIQLWFTCPELGHPLVDDNYDRPLHPLLGPFLRDYLFNPEGFDDNDDEMGHLFATGQDDSRTLARDMLDSWDIIPPASDL